MIFLFLIDNQVYFYLTGDSVSWTCDFVGSYHNYQATDCCFSEDGSLLAAGFEEIVTVWDSETWDLKRTFCRLPGTIRYVIMFFPQTVDLLFKIQIRFFLTVHFFVPA